VTLDLSQCDDRELAGLAVASQGQAFRELMRRHKDPVFRMIRSNIGDPDEALDLLQESFVSAFGAIRRYDPERPFRLWIARIAQNKCRDWARRRAVRSFFSLARSIEPDDDFESDVPGPAREAESRAELLLVEKAIAKLPQTLREVLVLRTVEEASQAEAAAILGISEKAVETRLYRARNQLKALLEDMAVVGRD
jgi:RNA polymerase sigma factor (sigma-70 family)